MTPAPIQPALICNANLLELASNASLRTTYQITAEAVAAEVKRRQVWDEDLNDRVTDLYHDGITAHRQGLPRPGCPYAAEGWDDRARSAKVRVVMPARPEGYYHAAPGTFD